MVLTNQTADDPSPLITYSPPDSWITGDDGTNNRYFQSTFSVTNTSGSSATLSFNGTGVWIYGAKRGNHDLFNVTLDGATTVGDGFSPDAQSQFQAILFSQQNLSQGLHTVTITNAPSNPAGAIVFMDIDYFLWESDVGSSGNAINSTIFSNTDPAFSYQQNGGWSPATSRSGSDGSVNSTVATTTNGASVSFSFQGDAVSIYGTVGDNQSEYSAQLDQQSPITYNASRSETTNSNILFYVDNLGLGEHVVTLTNQPVTPGLSLAIDHANVSHVVQVVLPSTTTSLQASATGSAGSGSAQSATTSSDGISGGALAGVIISVLVIAASLTGILFIFIRRRQRRYRLESARIGLPEPQFSPSGALAVSVPPPRSDFTMHSYASSGLQTQSSNPPIVNAPRQADSIVPVVQDFYTSYRQEKRPLNRPPSIDGDGYQRPEYGFRPSDEDIEAQQGPSRAPTRQNTTGSSFVIGSPSSVITPTDSLTMQADNGSIFSEPTIRPLAVPLDTRMDRKGVRASAGPSGPRQAPPPPNYRQATNSEPE